MSKKRIDGLVSSLLGQYDEDYEPTYPRKKSHLWPFPQSITHRHVLFLPTGDGIMIH